MKDTNRIVNKTRRDFLSMVSKAGFSASALSGSLLASGMLANRFAHAQGGVKRFCAVWAGNGSPNGAWLPNGTQMNDATRSLEGVKEVCNFREVNIVRGGHGNIHKALGSLRGGSDWTADTVDQQIASVIGTTTPYQSYQLGVHAIRSCCNEVMGRKGGRRIPPQINPRNAYSALFGGNIPVNNVNNVLAKKQSILDVNREALKRLQTKLGQFEREMLESHVDSLDKLEKRIIASSDPQPDMQEACKSPSWNANGYGTDTRAAFGHQTELQMDNIINAFACGLTNVMTLQLGNDQGDWNPVGTNFRNNYHNSCHAASFPNYVELNRYLNARFAYLIRGLMDRDDPAVPGTKMIDNTVVYFVTDMGDGRSHSGANGPNLVASRMPGFKNYSATKGGDNRHMIDAVTIGMGLEQYMGTNKNTHKIWPHGGGTVATQILA